MRLSDLLADIAVVAAFTIQKVRARRLVERDGYIEEFVDAAAPAHIVIVGSGSSQA